MKSEGKNASADKVEYLDQDTACMRIVQILVENLSLLNKHPDKDCRDL